MTDKGETPMSNQNQNQSERPTDLVTIYVMRSWLAPYRNTDMDRNDTYNAICMVKTPYGDAVRAYEGYNVGMTLYRAFESVAYWDEQSLRYLEVDAVHANDVELEPHQVWSLISSYCDRRQPSPDKWVLKPHVDRYALRWQNRMAQLPALNGVEAEAPEWMQDPNLVPAKGDK
jgi:hypothetical protein